MTSEFSVEQAQERLPELLDRVESGEEIVLTRFGVPSVRLDPVHQRRSGGGVSQGVVGAMWLAPIAGDVTGGDSSDGGAFDIGTDYGSGSGLDVPD